MATDAEIFQVLGTLIAPDGPYPLGQITVGDQTYTQYVCAAVCEWRLCRNPTLLQFRHARLSNAGGAVRQGPQLPRYAGS